MIGGPRPDATFLGSAVPVLVFLSAALLLAACSKPASSPAVQSSAAPAARANSQRVLDDAVKPDAPGCSAAVGSRGTVIWTGVRGLANTATGARITPDTVFDVGSVSKQFTATAALLLVDAGALHLQDSLAALVPGLPPWAATVTVTQLIHQTTGIPEYEGLLTSRGYQTTDRTTQEQALQALAAVPDLDFAPGTQFAYSNSNYLLLGEIVRRVSGVPLPQFLSAQIFSPLGLAMVMDPVGEVPGKAVSYTSEGGPLRVAGSNWEQVGDGAVQTTPSQLVSWADNYRTGKVGGPRLLEEQLAGAVPIGPHATVRYGAGIYLAADGGLDHDGAWAGYVAAFRVSKDRATAVAVSCNTDDQGAEALAASIAKNWM